MKNNSSILIDTGFIYALYCKKDLHHQRAKEAATVYNNATWLTTCFVFQEIFWLLKETHPLQIFQIEKTGILEVTDFENNQLREIEDIVKKYSDQQIDLADASLIFLAECLGHGDILSTDFNDFTTYRWNRIRPFNILL